MLGSMKMKMCPIERYIPIYMVVGGCFALARNSITLIRRIASRKEEQPEENSPMSKTMPIDTVISCFMFAWFVAGM